MRRLSSLSSTTSTRAPIRRPPRGSACTTAEEAVEGVADGFRSTRLRTMLVASRLAASFPVSAAGVRGDDPNIGPFCLGLEAARRPAVVTQEDRGHGGLARRHGERRPTLRSTGPATAL